MSSPPSSRAPAAPSALPSPDPSDFWPPMPPHERARQAQGRWVGVPTLLGGVLGFLVAVQAGPWLATHTWVDLVALGASMLASTWLILLLHEAGHALAAWAQGFVVDEVHAGPAVWQRGFDGRWRFKPRATHVFHGLTVMGSPLDRLRRRVLIVWGAGPVVTVLCALGVWAASLVVSAPSALLGDVLVGAALAAAVHLQNLALSWWAPKGDLRVIFVASRGGERWRDLEASIGLAGRFRRRVHPRDWPPVWVDVARRVDIATPHGPGLAWHAFQWASAAGTAEQTEAALARIFARFDAYPREFQAALWSIAAEINAGRRGDVASARRALERSLALDPQASPSVRRSAEAYIHLAEGHRAGALEAMRLSHEARRALPLRDGPCDVAERLDFVRAARLTPDEAKAVFGADAPDATDRSRLAGPV